MTLLQTLKTWAINWSLAILFAFAWLLLSASLDGESETDVARAVAADLQQAPADQRVAMQQGLAAFKE